MVKEITEDEENDRQDDDDSMSGKSSDIHNIHYWWLMSYWKHAHILSFLFMIFLIEDFSAKSPTAVDYSDITEAVDEETERVKEAMHSLIVPANGNCQLSVNYMMNLIINLPKSELLSGGEEISYMKIDSSLKTKQLV